MQHELTELIATFIQSKKDVIMTPDLPENMAMVAMTVLKTSQSAITEDYD